MGHVIFAHDAVPILKLWDELQSCSPYERAEQIRPMLEEINVECIPSTGRRMVYKMAGIIYRNLPPCISALRKFAECPNIHLKCKWYIKIDENVSTKSIYDTFIQHLQCDDLVFMYKGRLLDASTVVKTIRQDELDGDIEVEAHGSDVGEGKVTVVIHYYFQIRVKEKHTMKRMFDGVKKYMAAFEGKIIFSRGSRLSIDDETMVIDDPTATHINIHVYKVN